MGRRSNWCSYLSCQAFVILHNIQGGLVLADLNRHSKRVGLRVVVGVPAALGSRARESSRHTAPAPALGWTKQAQWVNRHTAAPAPHTDCALASLAQASRRQHAEDRRSVTTPVAPEAPQYPPSIEKPGSCSRRFFCRPGIVSCERASSAEKVSARVSH